MRMHAEVEVLWLPWVEGGDEVHIQKGRDCKRGKKKKLGKT